MAGVQRWTSADQEFARQKGLAFDEWVAAGRPTDGANAYWSPAIEKWKVDGRPVEVQVELRHYSASVLPRRRRAGAPVFASWTLDGFGDAAVEALNRFVHG